MQKEDLVNFATLNKKVVASYIRERTVVSTVTSPQATKFGTGVLMQADQRHFVLTVTHLVSRAAVEHIGIIAATIPGETEFQPLRRETYGRDPVEELDIAVLEISLSALPERFSKQFLSLDDLDLRGFNLASDLCVINGFPAMQCLPTASGAHAFCDLICFVRPPDGVDGNGVDDTVTAVNVLHNSTVEDCDTQEKVCMNE